MSTFNPLSIFFSRVTDGLVQQTPFPHVETEKALPSLYLEELLQHTKRSFSERLACKNKLESSTGRHVFWISPRSYSHFPYEVQSFWHDFYSQMRSSDLRPLLRHLVLPYVSSVTEQDNLRIDARIVEESVPSRLAAHIDRCDKLLTCIIYLPSENDDEGLGTYMYASSNEPTPVKMSRYVLNQSLSFPRTPNSWHGGEWLNSTPTTRRTLQIFVRRCE
jgi:hypothetical protein